MVRVNEKKKSKRTQYMPHLNEFCKYKFGEAHVVNTVPSLEQLLTITDQDLIDHFNMYTYGKLKPDDDDVATKRANSLAFKKKAISFYMPRNRRPWDDIRQEGNPTRSAALNDMIKTVYQKECRGKGVKSKARRNFEFEEFREFINLNLKTANRRSQKFLVNALWRMQFQLIARSDDMLHLEVPNLSIHPEHEFALKCKMKWSKNIFREDKCPDQIILGSLDDRLCPLLGLAAHYAVYLFENDTPSRPEGVFVERTASREFVPTHDTIRGVLISLVKDEVFKNWGGKELEGLLGTHSVRKAGMTYVIRRGEKEEHGESRGRWRGESNKVCKTYINLTQPYPDARIASQLCGPAGPCKYVLKESALSSVHFPMIIPGNT